MSVRLDGAAQYNHVNKTAIANLSADTKEEITSSMKVIGLLEGYTLEAGSSVFTASKELGILQSNGSWVW